VPRRRAPHDGIWRDLEVVQVEGRFEEHALVYMRELVTDTLVRVNMQSLEYFVIEAADSQQSWLKDSRLCYTKNRGGS